MNTKEIINYLRTNKPQSDFEKGEYQLLKNYLNALNSMNRQNALKYCINRIPSKESEDFQRGYATMYLEI